MIFEKIILQLRAQYFDRNPEAKEHKPRNYKLREKWIKIYAIQDRENTFNARISS